MQIPLLAFRRSLVTVSLMFLMSLSATDVSAHPVPDVPVRAYFNSDGRARFEVEIDVRCFAEDPENEPYFVNAVLSAMDDAELAELAAPVPDFLAKTLKIYFPPSKSAVEPDFKITFAKVGGGDQLEAGDDPVAMFAAWETEIPDGAGYQLEALETGELSVLFLNHLDGIKQKRMQVLFPGETSKVLDLGNIAEDAVKGAAPAEEPEPEPATDADSTDESAIPEEPSVVEPEARAEIPPSEEEMAEDNRSTLGIVAFVAIGLGVVVAVLLGRR